jgi:hypothetical protein
MTTPIYNLVNHQLHRRQRIVIGSRSPEPDISDEERLCQLEFSRLAAPGLQGAGSLTNLAAASTNTTFASPMDPALKDFPNKKSQRLVQLLKSRLPIDAQGVISYTARDNAVRGRARRRQSQNTRRDRPY